MTLEGRYHNYERVSALYQLILGRWSEYELLSLPIASEVRKGIHEYRGSHLICVHSDASFDKKAIHIKVLRAK